MWSLLFIRGAEGVRRPPSAGSAPGLAAAAPPAGWERLENAVGAVEAPGSARVA